MSRILSVGTATLDVVFGLDHHPEADEEMRAQSLRFCRGGNAANTAVILSRLGHDTTFFGVLADSPEAALIAQDFDRHGVDYRNCPRRAGRPPTSSIYLSGAARSIVHYRDLPELELADFAVLDPGSYDWLHAEGRNIAVMAETLRSIREAYPALPISIELEKPRDGVESLSVVADLLLCSRGFARYHGYLDAPSFLAWMQQHAPQATVVAAWGEEGAYGLAPSSSEVCHSPARTPFNVVDTLGAGDTFNAAMIAALAGRQALLPALAEACGLAGRKCGVAGFDF